MAYSATAPAAGVGRTFAFAPMSRAIRVLTWLFLLIPAVMGLAVRAGANRSLGFVAVALLVLFFLVWFVLRPTRFEVTEDALLIYFPAWRRTIPLGPGVRATALEFKQFCAEFGTPMRIGVGGLWGGFGWLWTSRRGLVDFCISRGHGLVLVERESGRPLLLTPDNPQAMVEALRTVSAM